MSDFTLVDPKGWEYDLHSASLFLLFLEYLSRGHSLGVRSLHRPIFPGWSALVILFS